MQRAAPERQRFHKAISALLAEVQDELLPSERQLAKRLGGSRSTLRLALEDLAREGLIEHVEGKGWRGRRRHGLLWLGGEEGSSAQVLEGLRSVLPADEWAIDVHMPQQSVKRLRTPPWDVIDPKRHRVVMLFSERGVDERLARPLADAGLQLCCLGCNLHRSYDTVCADYAQMSRLLVDEAVGRGHRHIAFIGARSLHQESPAFVARVNGYRSAMVARGLEGDVVLLGGAFDELDDRFATWLDERAAAGRRPTCAYLSGPGYAQRIARILHRLGIRVPEDMSLAGFGGPRDDEDELLHFERYTRIIEPFFAVGQAAGLRCLARIHSAAAAPPALTLVPSELRPGDSIRNIRNEPQRTQRGTERPG